MPRLQGIDICGGTLALNGVVGGDHLFYVDFKQRFDLEARIRQATDRGWLEVVENLYRCRKMAGIAVLDVSGHRVTDALLAAMLHQAFLMGAIYELDMFGQLTGRLFENLNTRFHQASSENKFASMMYGEISEDSRFRFLSAGHPFPAVFSKQHDQFMDVQGLCVSFPPLGMLPSLEVADSNRTMSPQGFTDKYEMNEVALMGEGDILLLHTDGLVDHRKADEDYYFPRCLEQKLRDVKHQPAAEILDTIKADLLAFSEPSDDISIVVIKREPCAPQ
jgi:serine phosphatase RsbU (regulator of sigma subunit)